MSTNQATSPGNDSAQIDARDAAFILLEGIHYDAQLAAIHSELQRHKADTEGLNDRIKEIELQASKVTGMRNDIAVSHWTDEVYDMLFRDAAHSMAAVGMMAPFIESVFVKAFCRLKELTGDRLVHADGSRWKAPWTR